MDSVNAVVIQKLAKRAERGLSKYGVTLDRTDLQLRDWLSHLQEELLDAACYVERLMQETRCGACEDGFDRPDCHTCETGIEHAKPRDMRTHPENGHKETF